mmetsp:Transcript_8443/g.14159  ORF Transcript_8443/g.14159 Transcript_8443/m.14159 type:complete len:91 (+) Transcript_8443:441-713(+)
MSLQEEEALNFRYSRSFVVSQNEMEVAVRDQFLAQDKLQIYDEAMGQLSIDPIDWRMPNQTKEEYLPRNKKNETVREAVQKFGFVSKVKD